VHRARRARTRCAASTSHGLQGSAFRSSPNQSARGHNPFSEWSQCNHGGGGCSGRDLCQARCTVNQFSEGLGISFRCLCVVPENAATSDESFRTYAAIARQKRACKWLRAWKPCVPKMAVDRSRAGEPRRKISYLQDHVATVAQTKAIDVG
jgi:hypothetical protein